MKPGLLTGKRGSQEFTDIDLPNSLGWWFPASTVFTPRSHLLTCGHIFYFYFKDGSVVLASSGDRLGVLQNFLPCTEQPHNKDLLIQSIKSVTFEILGIRNGWLCPFFSSLLCLKNTWPQPIHIFFKTTFPLQSPQNVSLSLSDISLGLDKGNYFLILKRLPGPSCREVDWKPWGKNMKQVRKSDPNRATFVENTGLV